MVRVNASHFTVHAGWVFSLLLCTTPTAVGMHYIFTRGTSRATVDLDKKYSDSARFEYSLCYSLCISDSPSCDVDLSRNEVLLQANRAVVLMDPSAYLSHVPCTVV